jgi:hypothetical protein
VSKVGYLERVYCLVRNCFGLLSRFPHGKCLRELSGPCLKGLTLNKHAQRLLLYQHYSIICTYTQGKLPDRFLSSIVTQTHWHLNTLWPSLPLSHQYARELHQLKQCEIIADGFRNAKQILIPIIFLLMISMLFFRLTFQRRKPNLLYIRNQSVPRCKHFPPRL